MRCNNCGWMNADSDAHCIKCNSPLGGRREAVRPADVVREAPVEPGTQASERPVEPRQNAAAGGEPGPDLIACPSCQYPASRRVHHCPMCGSSLDAAAASEGTVDPFRTPAEQAEATQPTVAALPPKAPQPVLLLERIGRPGESSKTLSFEATDDQVSVNRQSVDENNYSITSREQAAFYFAGGKWWLVDRSELKTTFIQAKEPVALQEGDIIQMGDRRFIFHSERPRGEGGAGP